MDHVIDHRTATFTDRWHFSHAVRSRGLLFLSGVTGTRPDGFVDPQPARQFDQLFQHLVHSLETAGVGLESIVELTSYHVNLRQHLDVFVTVKDEYLVEPYPAWSAIGVSELITPGALVELRAIADAGR